MIGWNGKTALVTGASSGIGEAFAVALAGKKVNLVLVARSADKLEKLAADLRAAHGIQVMVVRQDLGQPGAAAEVFTKTQAASVTVDVLINNAGFGKWGEFLEFPPEVYSEMIALNVSAVVELTQAYLPGMLERRGIGVIHVGSTASLVPVPYAAIYAATKAFVLSFSEGLAGEYADRGVRVMTLCPGGTDTNFAAVANASVKVPEAGRETPTTVVDNALRAFESGQTYVVSGVSNYLTAGVLPRFLTRGAVLRLAARMWKRTLGR
jgi:short-subunit dehydrogenase